MSTILDEYLTLHDPTALATTPWTRESTLSAAFRDARNVSGRSAPGVIDEAGAHAWIGAVAWLCLVDQLGQAVRHRDDPMWTGTNQSEARFRRVLRRFSTAESGHHRFLWSLRCSLAHNYSLYNAADNPPTVFVLHAQSTHIKQLMTKSLSRGLTRVRVDLMALASLGEQIVGTVQREHQKRRVLPGVPTDEFTLRFFMEHGTEPPADRMDEFEVVRISAASPPVTGWTPASADDG